MLEQGGPGVRSPRSGAGEGSASSDLVFFPLFKNKQTLQILISGWEAGQCWYSFPRGM